MATFGVYFLLDEKNVLTAAKVFTSIALFNILRLPLFDLPTVISAIAQVSINQAEKREGLVILNIVQVFVSYLVFEAYWAKLGI